MIKRERGSIEAVNTRKRLRKSDKPEVIGLTSDEYYSIEVFSVYFVQYLKRYYIVIPPITHALAVLASFNCCRDSFIGAYYELITVGLAFALAKLYSKPFLPIKTFHEKDRFLMQFAARQNLQL